MTEVEFKQLPFLLMPRQAREALGCDRYTLRDLRTSFPLLGLRLPGKTHWRYRKFVVAKIAGIKYE